MSDLLNHDKLFYEWTFATSERLKGRQEWDEAVIHMSDLGICPRQVALRLMGAEKRHDPQERFWAQQRMFEEAHEAEERCAKMLEFHGILVAEQVELPGEPTGRLDYVADYEGYPPLVGGRRVVDLKTIMGELIIKGRDLPKLHNALQVIAYHDAALKMDLDITQNPLLLYWPAGGRAPSAYFEIAPDLYAEEFEKAMNDLRMVPVMVADGVLPKRLPRQAKIVGREPNKRMVLTTHWNCSWKWCDYCIDSFNPGYGGCCQPLRAEGDTGARETTVANWKVTDGMPAGGWLTNAAGSAHAADLRGFLVGEARKESRKMTEQQRHLARTLHVGLDSYFDA